MPARPGQARYTRTAVFCICECQRAPIHRYSARTPAQAPVWFACVCVVLELYGVWRMAYGRFALLWALAFTLCTGTALCISYSKGKGKSCTTYAQATWVFSGRKIYTVNRTGNTEASTANVPKSRRPLRFVAIKTQITRVFHTVRFVRGDFHRHRHRHRQ
ncbi:hypothetical protein M5D96_011245 [Drosophila gunungcola]|uniref:Uncharacterized protein n=1 Tax=Drosophila gunungcola TaxID=103775 RepID=A0A9P9YF30_9MUSC|nr:hypothetical protein M5D96_011245 [Drosophila gunungcola]